MENGEGGKEGGKELNPASCEHKIQEISVHTPKVLYSRGKNIVLQKKLCYALLLIYHITTMLRKTDHYASEVTIYARIIS